MNLLWPLVLLLTLLGCAEYQTSPGLPPSVWVREVEPPPLRYQIKYQNRGLQVVPDFAGIDRNGEFVVVPEFPDGIHHGFVLPAAPQEHRTAAGKLIRTKQTP